MTKPYEGMSGFCDQGLIGPKVKLLFFSKTLGILEVCIYIEVYFLFLVWRYEFVQFVGSTRRWDIQLFK